MQRKTYEVVVSNVGTVYTGRNENDALFNARIYVDQSKAHYGRASGESVTVFCDGDIVQEYIGTRDTEDA